MIYSPTKPGISTRIDWSDPLSQGLVGCWLFNEGGGKFTDLTGNSTVVSSPYTIWTPRGLYYDGGYSNMTLFDAPKIPTTTPFTAIVGVIGQSTGASICLLRLGSTGYSNGWAFKFNQFNNTGKLGISKFGSAGDLASSLSFPTSDTIVGMVFNTDKTTTIYSGSNKATISDTSALVDPFNSVLCLGNHPSGGDSFKGTVKFLFIYNRALSAQEIRQIHELTAGW